MRCLNLATCPLPYCPTILHFPPTGSGGGGSGEDFDDSTDDFGGDELSDYGDGFTNTVNATPTTAPTAPAQAADPTADAFDPAENGGVNGHPGLFAPANGPLADEDDDVLTTYYEDAYGGGYYGDGAGVEGGFAKGRRGLQTVSDAVSDMSKNEPRRLMSDYADDAQRKLGSSSSDESTLMIRVKSTRSSVFVTFPGGERARFRHNGYGLDVQTSLPSANYYDRVAGLCGTFGPDRDTAFAAQVELPEPSVAVEGETKCQLHPNSDRDRLHDWGTSWQAFYSVLALDNIDCDGRKTHDFCYKKASSSSAASGCEAKQPGFTEKTRELCWGLSAVAYDACVLDAASTCSLSFGGQTVGAEASRSQQLRRNGNPGVVQFQGPGSITVSENVRIITLTVVRVYGTAGELAVPLTLTPGRPGLPSANPATMTCDPTGKTYVAASTKDNCAADVGDDLKLMLRWEDGDESIRTVQIPIVDDNVQETAKEYFVVEVKQPVKEGGIGYGKTMVEVTIVDDDAAAAVDTTTCDGLNRCSTKDGSCGHCKWGFGGRLAGGEYGVSAEKAVAQGCSACTCQGLTPCQHTGDFHCLSMTSQPDGSYRCTPGTTMCPLVSNGALGLGFQRSTDELEFCNGGDGCGNCLLYDPSTNARFCYKGWTEAQCIGAKSATQDFRWCGKSSLFTTDAEQRASLPKQATCPSYAYAGSAAADEDAGSSSSSSGGGSEEEEDASDVADYFDLGYLYDYSYYSGGGLTTAEELDTTKIVAQALAKAGVREEAEPAYDDGSRRCCTGTGGIYCQDYSLYPEFAPDGVTVNGCECPTGTTVPPTITKAAYGGNRSAEEAKTYTCPPHSWINNYPLGSFVDCTCNWGLVRGNHSCTRPNAALTNARQQGNFVYSSDDSSTDTTSVEAGYSCPSLSWINFYPPLGFNDCTCNWGLRRHTDSSTGVSTCQNFTEASPKGLYVVIEIAIDGDLVEFNESPQKQVALTQKCGSAMSVEMDKVAILTTRKLGADADKYTDRRARARRLAYDHSVGANTRAARAGGRALGLTAASTVVQLQLSPGATARSAQATEMATLQSRLADPSNSGGAIGESYESRLQLATGSEETRVLGVKVVDNKPGKTMPWAGLG
jgi:hypothetical protein